MRLIIILSALLFVVCSSPVAPVSDSTSVFRICNVTVNIKANIYYASYVNGQLMGGEKFCEVKKGTCLDTTVKDGTLLIMNSTGYYAYNGDTWEF